MIACNDERNFLHAKSYSPSRWLESENSAGQFKSDDIGATNLVVPFGVGKRTCPGKRFVEIELLLLLVKVCILIVIAKLLEFEKRNLITIYSYSWSRSLMLVFAMKWKPNLNFYWCQKYRST